MPKATNPDYNPFATAIAVFGVLLCIMLIPLYWPIYYYAAGDKRNNNKYWTIASSIAGGLAFLSMFIYS